MMNLQRLTKPIKIHNIELHISSVILFAAGFWFKFLNRLLIAYIITAIHECSHILTARRTGVKVSGVEILPFGITMRLGENGIRNPKDEIKIAIAGPLSNLIIAYAAYGLYSGEARDFIIFSSLAIGIFNLLPILPLDGGRIMRAILVEKYGCIRGSGIAMKVTGVFAVMILLAGALILYVTKFNFSILLIGGFLTANITEERKSTNMIIMKDILYSRKKIEESGNGGVLVASDSDKAKKVLSKLTYDKYYMINIIDRNMRLVYTVTETQLIEGISVYGMNTPMRKFVGI